MANRFSNLWTDLPQICEKLPQNLRIKLSQSYEKHVTNFSKNK